jgi:cyclopropane fatty-acyl-phospholipid synthase-like methyltransferase
MNPAEDSNIDYKALVRRGYDRCAGAYEQARKNDPTPALDLLTRRLPDAAHLLDIGCGAGVPIARLLSQRFRVTGVDISAGQVRRARANVPTATFIQADIMTVEFAPATFDAAVAFYSIFHIPRDEHPDLFHRIRHWLKPGGYLFATLSTSAESPYTEDDFFGTTMYWSSHSLEDYKTTLADIGFTLLEITTVGHGYHPDTGAPPEHHPLILARTT